MTAEISRNPLTLCQNFDRKKLNGWGKIGWVSSNVSRKNIRWKIWNMWPGVKLYGEKNPKYGRKLMVSVILGWFVRIDHTILASWEFFLTPLLHLSTFYDTHLSLKVTFWFQNQVHALHHCPGHSSPVESLAGKPTPFLLLSRISLPPDFSERSHFPSDPLWRKYRLPVTKIMSRWYCSHCLLRFRNNEKNRSVFRKCAKLSKYSSLRLIHHLYPVILPSVI